MHYFFSLKMYLIPHLLFLNLKSIMIWVIHSSILLHHHNVQNNPVTEQLQEIVHGALKM